MVSIVYLFWFCCCLACAPLCRNIQHIGYSNIWDLVGRYLPLCYSPCHSAGFQASRSGISISSRWRFLHLYLLSGCFVSWITFLCEDFQDCDFWQLSAFCPAYVGDWTTGLILGRSGWRRSLWSLWMGSKGNVRVQQEPCCRAGDQPGSIGSLKVVGLPSAYRLPKGHNCGVHKWW